ncbi:hypothetical protein WDU94_004817 [Cyamophila willieti]
MDETDKKLIVAALRATVVSQKDGVELHKLNSDYRELEGEHIPYRALGFPSVEAYIRTLTNDFTIVPKQGSLYVVAKKNDTLAHIQDLIKGQSNKKKSKPAYKSSRGKFGGFSSNYNSRSYKKPSPISHSSRSGVGGGGNVNKFSSNKATFKPAGYKNWDDPAPHIQNAPQRKQSPPPRRPSPQRRKSPPPRKTTPPSRERSEPARSNSSNREASKEKIRDLVNDYDINKSHEQTASRQPVRTKGPDKMPPPVPAKVPTRDPTPSAPRLLGAGNEILSKYKCNNLMNLRITVDNDLFSPDEPPPNWKTSPVSVPAQLPPVYSHLPNMTPVSNGPDLSSPAPAPFMTGAKLTHSVPSPLPSPALSLHNGAASSSKSSSPEVFVELPAGASPEEEFNHLAKYLFNEDPEIHIKERQPDPKNKKLYQYYAHVQVGTHPRISTLPSDYNTREEARRSVILLALNQFNKIKNEKLAKSLKKTTEKLNLMIDRIYSLARNSNNGMVATRLEELYEKKFGEILPPGWTSISEVVNHPRLEVNKNVMATIIYTKKSETNNYSAGAALPNLVLPEENEWPVFVTLMTSVSSVYVKIVNEMSEEFDKMSDEFNTFMNHMKPDAVSKVEVGSLYCLYDEDAWLRVEVMKPVEALTADHFLCKYIDHGEESVHHIDELYPLYDMFRRLPAQAIELFLPESDVFEELFDYKQVEDQFVGKSLVALIRTRNSGTIAATLYNTDVEPNVNMNHLIFTEICQLFNVSSVLEENMFKESVYVSFISGKESCIYVQVDSIMFKYLISQIDQLVASNEINHHGVNSLAELEEYLDYQDVLLAKFDQDGVYYRAQVLEVDKGSNNLKVLFIDYGNTDLVSCNNLVKLIDTSAGHLCLIPPQARKVNLAGFHGQFSPEVMNKLSIHLNGDEPVILKMTAAGVVIHKRDKEMKIVNINSLVLGVDLNTSGSRASPIQNGTKDAHCSPLDPPVIPSVGTMIDVLVETVSSPTNFWIRSEEIYNDWVELVEEMDAFYSEESQHYQPVKPEDIKQGASFAFYYEDMELWQRVTINSRISSDHVALFLVDCGKIITADTSLLCYLVF